jgi:hypothetical protein
VDEYAPHATGLVGIHLTARSLPPVVAKLTGIGGEGNLLAFKQVADAQGRNLSDAPDGPRFRGGRALPEAYDREFEFPLKNLLRDVTVVKTLRGVVRVPLPERVDTLRIEPLTQGAVGKAGPVEVKVASFYKGQNSINGKQFPNATLRLEYKGVSPARIRVVAYDADNNLIAVSSTGWSGNDTGGSGDFRVRGEPAALAVKLITVGHAEYEFSLDDIPLAAAAGQPEKLSPAAFPGHDSPLTAEFVRVTAAQFPSKAQLRLVNHSDKDIRTADLRLVYLDAAGKELRDWPNAPCAAPETADGKRPPVMVPKNASAVIEVNTPFMPATTATLRATALKVVFSDASVWPATPGKK